MSMFFFVLINYHLDCVSNVDIMRHSVLITRDLELT